MTRQHSSSGVGDALLAASLVAIGSCIRGQLLLAVGLPVVAAGLFVASRAMWGVASDHHPVPAQAATNGRDLWWAFAVMAVVGLLAPSTPGGPVYDLLKRGYFVAGLAAVCLGSRTGSGWPRVMNGLLVAASLIHLAGPVLVPDPVIDNWAWTQSSLAALIGGHHPYRVAPGDIIHGAFYEGRTASVYPYMPMTLLVNAPVYWLFGDYRFLGAASLPATLILVGRLGRRVRVPRDVVDSAQLLVALHPRGFSLTCLGWLEPFLGFLLVSFAYLAVRAPRGLASASLFLAIPAWKQYFVAPALLFMVDRRHASVRTIAAALLLPIATVVPFLVWDWQATLRGILGVVSDADGPRLDSTSLVALVARFTGTYPDRWLSAALQLAVGTYTYARLRHAGVAGLLLSSALAMLVTFLTGWQAFVNYFYIVSVLLMLAAMLRAACGNDGLPIGRACGDHE